MIIPILVIGLVLRIINLNQSLWLDEAISALAAQKFSLLGFLTEYAKSDFHPPFYFFVMWLWTRIFGSSEIALRLPSVLMGVLAIYIIYLICTKLYSKKIGILSSLLLATNPLHIYYSQEARMYAMACLAILLNLFLVSKIIKNEKINLPILILSNIFVLSSDYVAYLIFPAQLCFFYLSKEKNKLRFWLKGISISFLIWVIWIPIFLSQVHVGLKTSGSLPVWKAVVGGFDIKSILLTPIKFVIGRINLQDKLTYYSLLIPICSLVGFLVVRGVKTSSTILKNLAINWFLIPIILASGLSILVPIFSYFRLLFVLPAFLILVTLGIASFKNKLAYLFLTLFLGIQIIASFIYLFNTKYHREDWKGLVSYLGTKPNSIVLFESSGELPPFEYYSQGKVNSQGALKNFPAKVDADIVDLSKLKFNDVFLVDYLVEISDPTRIVDKRLSSMGYKITETKDFVGLGFLYHYVK